MFLARRAHMTLLYPLTEPVHSCTISTPWGALHCCHYRCWINNHDANLVHMPGTHFATGWLGGSCLPVSNVGLKLMILRLSKIEKMQKLKFCVIQKFIYIIAFIWDHNLLIWLISLRDLFYFAVSMMTMMTTTDRHGTIIQLLFCWGKTISKSHLNNLDDQIEFVTCLQSLAYHTIIYSCFA